MVETSDPPSDERKPAEFWKRVRSICRVLVNKRTLMIAICVIKLMVRIAEIISGLLGDF